MHKQQISTANAPSAIGPYSQGIISGDIVFCSGQVPLNPSTGKLVDGPIGQQTEQVLNNLQAVLAQNGLTLDNVVKTTIFLKDLNDFTAVNEAYAKFFHQPYPARSTVEVSRLPRDARIEIEAIARA